MPKKFLFILGLCVLLCFSGCKSENAATASTAETPLEAETITVSGDFTPTSTAAISLPVSQETTLSQDGAVLFVSTYQNVELVLPDPQVADAVVLDLLNRTDTADTAKDILAQAEEDYTPSDAWQSYICRNMYTPTRLDGGVLSLFGQLTTFQGSAHAESVYGSVSYDLTTGEALALHNILLPHFDMDVLKDAIVDAIAKQEKEIFLYTGYAEVVDARFAEDTLDDENWYFSQTGLCFYFSPYEIAPYSTGVVVAEVPYSKLTGILEDAYFPEEIPATKGAMVQEAFDAASQEQYESFWEITLEKGSQKILLHPDNTLCNIRLEVGSNDGEFIPEYTLFAANALGTQDAIVITYDNAASLSKLRISYSASGKTVYQSIS